MAQAYTYQELQQYFEDILALNQSSYTVHKLPIDCVVLAMPESSKLGEVFVSLGVSHVVAFEFEQDTAECSAQDSENEELET